MNIHYLSSAATGTNFTNCTQPIASGSDGSQQIPDIKKKLIKKSEDISSAPEYPNINSRDVDVHEFKSKLASAIYPIEPPPILPLQAPANISDSINDNTDCYLLNAEQFDTASYLSSYAAEELKSLYPDLFSEMDINPADSEGGGWDVIMTNPEERKYYQQYQAIAQYVYQYQQAERIDEIMDDPQQMWASYKTTYGVYRTNSFYYDEEGIEGCRLIIDDKKYQQTLENEALKYEIEKLKSEIKITTKEKDYYKSMTEKASRFTHNVLSTVAENIFNQNMSDEEKSYSLNATFFNPDNITFNELLTRQNLIIGKKRQIAEASFNACRNLSTRKATTSINSDSPENPEKRKLIK